MKRQLFLFSIVTVLVLAALTLASQAPAQKPRTDRALPPLSELIKPQAQTAQIQKAVVEFTEPVKLLGVILKGSYLFLHDEGKMARGERCSWVYGRGDTGRFDRLVASFHCIPVNREEPAGQFRVTVVGVNSPFTLPEVVEYRFAGSTEGHQVPKAAE